MTESLEERFQNLHEFVTQARTNLNRNNWDYLIGGSETETTLARNRAALDAWGFRPRVLRDVSNVDCSRTFFGKKLRIPVLCSAVGGLEVFEPGGGATVAAATREFGNGMILSSGAHPGLEKTADASGSAFKIFFMFEATPTGSTTMYGAPSITAMTHSALPSTPTATAGANATLPNATSDVGHD
jgi:isopentenyl diphosphate isomerase/L-lactate dehydrogenase-like FMN-dependent dehydrogenase